MDKAHEELLARIGSLTRTLRDSIRELRLDRAVAEAAQAIPDARDRLRYVAHMTEQAASRCSTGIRRMRFRCNRPAGNRLGPARNENRHTC
ncbi:hypothetical protein CAL18_14695 [Bordetella genomosp. 7]|nr:hypothetical protein CAL18_14695 [Bordetella genomosp. 7]